MKYIKKSNIKSVKTFENKGKVEKEDLDILFKFDQDVMNYLDEKEYSYTREVGTGGDEYDMGEYAFRYELPNHTSINIYMKSHGEDSGFIDAVIKFERKRPYFMVDTFNSETMDRYFRYSVDVHKYMKKLHEKQTYDDVLKNDLSYSDKQKALKQISLDNIKEYNNMKKSLDSIFYNIEEELNNPSIYKIIEDNPFSKKYVMLLTKRREQLILQETITKKKETIDQYNKELVSIEDTEDVVKMNADIKEQEEELQTMEDKLPEYDILEGQFNEWDDYIDDFERDVKRDKNVIPTI